VKNLPVFNEDQERMLKYSRVFLAPIEVKILLREKLSFAGFAERPTEVPAKPCKKSFWNKRLKRKAGNSF
jgi:hypothetical protein